MSTKLNPKEKQTYLSKKFTAYYPAYAEIIGSVTAALLFSELENMYLHYKHETGAATFFHSNEKMMKRLAFGIKEFKNAKAKLIELGLIKSERKKFKGVSHYEINVDKWEKMKSCWSKRDQPVGPKGTNTEMGRKGPSQYRNRNNKQKKETVVILNGDVDNLGVIASNAINDIAPDGAVPFEKEKQMSHLQIQLSEIPKITSLTMRRLLDYPEYIVIDILSSYRKNKHKVLDVNKYLLGAAKQRSKSHGNSA